jgi:hypothetical protein
MGFVMVSESVVRIRVPAPVRSVERRIDQRAEVPSGRRHALRRTGLTLCGLSTTHMRVWDGQDYLEARGSSRNRCKTCVELARDSYSYSTISPESSKEPRRAALRATRRGGAGHRLEVQVSDSIE